MFLEKQVYQGSSGVVYPHPVIDRISNERTEKQYTAVFLKSQLENHIFYYLGQFESARTFFTRASIGLSEPTSALYYNDQPPHMIFYQGLAFHKLGRSDKSRAIFARLIQYGQQHLEDTVKMDYFAISLPNFLVFEENLPGARTSTTTI